MSKEEIEKELNELYDKFCKVLDYATGSRCTKPEVDIEDIKKCIDEHIDKLINEELELHTA